jgi:phosphodiesterase/alkaline phosphatase D-like protein
MAAVEAGPWTGAVTPTSAVVKAKFSADAAAPLLFLSEGDTFDPAAALPVKGNRVQEDSQVWKFELTDLKPGSLYVYRMGEEPDAPEGRFRTFPDKPSSFRFAYGACAATGSDHPVFETIRKLDPLFFMNIGDFHYENIGEPNPDRFRKAYDRILASPRQSALYRSTAFAYMWDDHDFGPNDSDRTSPARTQARQVYREYVPHYPLIAGDGDRPIYQAFSVGRVRFILTDLRSERLGRKEEQPKGEVKSMMGEEQKQWFKQELLSARQHHPLIFWVSSVPWITTSGAGDSWNGYRGERRELANFIAENKISGVVILAGDAHMLAADDGTNSDFSDSKQAPIPVLHAAPLDRPGRLKGGPYSAGAYSPETTGNGCFGLVDVEDKGSEIIVRYSGRDQENTEHVALTFTVKP